MRNVLQSYLQQTQAQKAESMRLPPPPFPHHLRRRQAQGDVRRSERARVDLCCGFCVGKQMCGKAKPRALMELFTHEPS